MRPQATIIAILSSLTLAFLFFSCKVAEPKKAVRDPGTIVLRLAETMSADHPSSRAGDYFASLVLERSGGRIKIRSYFNGKLGSPDQVIAQVQFGGIAMARVNALELAEAVPALRTIFEPQIYAGGIEAMGKIASAKEAIADACLRERLTPIVFYYPDIRCIYGDGLRFRTIEDFKGIRIGAIQSGILKDALEAFGAVPVNLVSADTYKSLRSGYINARETTFSEFMLSNDYTFASDLSLSRYLASPDLIIMSSEVLNDLADQDRRLISICAQESFGFHKAELQKFQLEWIHRLETDGKTVEWENDRFKSDLQLALK
ncbi:TRAP transporter substrate-binding protein [Treponema sp.]